MELIDRYVYAVVQKLPEQQRNDIRKELYGLIEDMLEERSPLAAPSLEDVEQVLQQLGHPSVMAAKYRGHERYLISPALFDSYLSVIKIVLMAILLSMSVVFVIDCIVEPAPVLDHFIDYLVSLISAGSQGFVWVTVIYAFIDYGAHKKYAGHGDMSKKWSPAELPPIPDPKSQIKLSEPVTGIIFTVLFTVIFMFGSELIGAYRFNDGVMTSIPLMNSDVVDKYLPFIGVLGALGVMREALKMIIRRRTLTILIFHIGVSLLGLVFAAILLNTPGFWNDGFLSQLQAVGWAPQGGEDYESLKTIWFTVTHNLIYFIGLFTVIDLVSEVYKWFRIRMPEESAATTIR